MDEVQVVTAVINALEASQVPYMLVGSLSSNAYGIQRQTKDADFVIQLGSFRLSKLLDTLPSGFRLESQIGFETITSTTRYRMHYDSIKFMIEFFELSDDPHDQIRFQRRIQSTFSGAKTFLPRPEDVVITKLRWFNISKRPKDLEDVANILSIQQGNLDLAYIRQWTAKHKTAVLFEDLLAKTPKI